MKRDKVTTTFAALAGATLLFAAGCSSSQKPAPLGAATGGAAGGASAGGPSASDSASGSATPSASPSSSASASGGTTPPAAAQTTMAGPATIVVTPAADANASAALAAFVAYRSTLTQMELQAKFIQNFDMSSDLDAYQLGYNAIVGLRQRGNHYDGTSKSTASVKATDMAAKPLPTVTVVECYDGTKFNEVFGSGPKKGQIADATPFTHPFPITATVHKSADGHWRVTKISPDVSHSC